jgi:hypothetical protein
MLALAAGGNGMFASSNGPPGTECISRNATIETSTNTKAKPMMRPIR